jgi:hypothetical protein
VAPVARRILFVYYSQSGQMARVAKAIATPLIDAGHDVTTIALEPQKPYPFPWPFWQFLDAFPESVQHDPAPIKPWKADGRFDLVVLCYTVWYLSPAPPITAMLKSEEGRRVLRDTPVITVTACRNMWVMAQEQVKALLQDARARHCDHVALIDPGPALATFITTPRWMFTGRRTPMWGMPAAGLTESDVAATARFGKAIARALDEGVLDGSRPVLRELGAARVDPALLASERIGRRSFSVWSRLVRAAGTAGSASRLPVLALYVTFLITAIITIVPVSMLIRAALKPLVRTKLEAEAAQFEQPSGSGTARVGEFS